MSRHVKLHSTFQQGDQKIIVVVENKWIQEDLMENKWIQEDLMFMSIIQDSIEAIYYGGLLLLCDGQRSMGYTSKIVL